MKSSYDGEEDLINHIRFKEAISHLNNMPYEKEFLLFWNIIMVTQLNKYQKYLRYPRVLQNLEYIILLKS